MEDYIVPTSPPNINDVTLVTQLDFGRWGRLMEMLTNWKGPASVSVYVTREEYSHFVSTINSETVLMSRKNVALQVVFKIGDLYPINFLRNVATRRVITNFVFVVDVDLIPNMAMHETLRKYTSVGRPMPYEVLVVPAFEAKTSTVSVPKTKPDLLLEMDRGTIAPSYLDVFPKGHGPTQFEKWKKYSVPYQVMYADGYQP